MQKSGLYTRQQHLEKLQAIRDMALNDENYKVGLAAEIAVGRAAGLYESFDPEGQGGDQEKLMPPEAMTTDAIKARLAQLQRRALPPPDEQGPPIQQGEFTEVFPIRKDEIDF